MAFTITAANSVYALSIPGLYSTPQMLQGYSADAAFDTDSVAPSEVVMGVDGRMSAGYVPYVTAQTVTIMPDSPSSVIFDNWLAKMKERNEVLYANAVITLPSIGRKYAMTRGVLTAIQSIPGTRKVLVARPFTITWQDVSPATF